MCCCCSLCTPTQLLCGTVAADKAQMLGASHDPALSPPRVTLFTPAYLHNLVGSWQGCIRSSVATTS